MPCQPFAPWPLGRESLQTAASAERGDSPVRAKPRAYPESSLSLREEIRGRASPPRDRLGKLVTSSAALTPGPSPANARGEDQDRRQDKFRPSGVGRPRGLKGLDALPGRERSIFGDENRFNSALASCNVSTESAKLILRAAEYESFLFEKRLISTLAEHKGPPEGLGRRRRSRGPAFHAGSRCRSQGEPQAPFTGLLAAFVICGRDARAPGLVPARRPVNGPRAVALVHGYPA